MAKKQRMKNGLDSLFEDNFHDIIDDDGTEEIGDAGVVNGGIESLRISLIEPNRNQPRSDFDEEKLNELAENIGQHGVLQPILVRPIGNDGYQIVAGERRWRASRIAGLTEIPALVRDLSDVEVAQIALIENLQREDLNPIEEALAFKRLADEFGMTQEEISKIVGKSRAGVANSMRLLKLIPTVQEALIDGDITVGHAKILAGVENEVDQDVFCMVAKSEKFSVRQFENYVNKIMNVRSGDGDDQTSSKVSSKRSSADLSFGDSFKAYILQSQQAFHSEYGVNANVKAKRDGTIKMEVAFSSDEEFKEFMARITDKS